MGTLSGDGYYQDLDEDRFCDFDLEDDAEIQEIKTRNELSYKDPKYYGIHDKIIDKNPNKTVGSKSYRRAFCEERNKIHKERADRFNEDRENWEKSNTSKTKVFCRCKNCGGGFEAKIADRKRGWARFCSKSCKAQQW